MESFADITRRKQSLLTQIDRMEWEPALHLYKIVNDLDDYRVGRYVRWITEDFKLTTGGILVKMDDERLTCRTRMNRFITVKLDNCIVLQKISQEEAILMAVLGGAAV